MRPIDARIKEQLSKLRQIVDDLENFAGCSDFGSSRQDLYDEAAELAKMVDKLEECLGYDDDPGRAVGM